MHREVEDTGLALAAMGRLWKSPIAAYSNTGHYEPPRNWNRETSCSERGLESYLNAWVDTGARIVGGCCGFGSMHIQNHCAGASLLG